MSDTQTMKSGSWFGRHKVLTGVIALVIIIIIAAAAGSKSKKTATTSAATSTSQPPSRAAIPAKTKASPPKMTTPTTTTIPARRNTAVAVTLGAGNYTGGEEVAAGLYNVTAGPSQAGNFIVTGTDSYNEILGNVDGEGVPEIRAQISKGDSINISGLSQVIFTPVTSPLVTHQALANLYAGTWTVGQDVGAGRYIATPGAGQSGNFIIENEGVNEILGGSDGVPSVTFTVQNGDVISISGLSQVTLTPTSS